MFGRARFSPQKETPPCGGGFGMRGRTSGLPRQRYEKMPYLYTMVRIKVSLAILKWVRWRAPHVVAQFPQFESWLKGEKQPTLKQIEKLAQKAYIPLEYFFLEKPPKEINPIDFYRTNKGTIRAGTVLYDPDLEE